MSLPDADVLFSHFATTAGSQAAARAKFQSLITELVAVQHPDANEVAGPGGTDWGIDTYVGSLADDVFVWQSKFFVTWNNKDPQKNVRESYKQLIGKSKANGIVVRSWTLCVPCILAPAEQNWFDGWAKRKRSEDGVEIDMWNGVLIRRLLSQADARGVLKEFFPDQVTDPMIQDLQEPQDLSRFDQALFVKQLEVAGYTNTDSARGSFFNAEILARDVIGRGDSDAIRGIRDIDAEVHAVWEAHFNTRQEEADNTGRMKNLIQDVLSEVTDITNPLGLGLLRSHKRGFMHRVVDDRRAGWVVGWPEIALGHDENGADLNSSMEANL